MTDTTDTQPSSKVARLLSEYGLEGLGEELEDRWTGDGVERTSLRDLADYFNKRLLERALIDAGMSALDSDVSTTYRDLTDDDVSTGVRTDTRTRLDSNGIDVDDLESDFVSYQAIRSYLTEYRGAEYRSREGPRKHPAADDPNALRDRRADRETHPDRPDRRRRGRGASRRPGVV